MCTLIFVSNCFYIVAIFDFETLSKIYFVKTLKGAGSFHDTRKTMKELSANDTSRYPKVVKIALNHGCQ